MPCRMAGPRGHPPLPVLSNSTGLSLQAARDEALPAEGTLRDHLFKDSRKGRVFPVSRPRKGVKEAVLEYRIAATAEDGAFSLADITLHTGRTHQIRVQFASRKHPLWGDGKYGSRAKGAIALQSARLQFFHPVSGDEIELCFAPSRGGTVGLFYLIFNKTSQTALWRGHLPSTCERGATLAYRVVRFGVAIRLLDCQRLSCRERWHEPTGLTERLDRGAPHLIRRTYGTIQN